jgi:hypothetical protein
VELVVVVIVLLVMLALGSMLLNGTSNDGRGTECINKMQNMSEAVRVYDAKKQKYPGYKMLLTTNSKTTITISWQTALLPYMQRNDVWQDWLTGTKTTPFLDYTVCPSLRVANRSQPWTTYVANCGHSDAGGPDTKSTAVFHDYTLANPVYMTSTIISGGDCETNTIMLSENVDAHYWTDTDEWLAGFVYDSGTQINDKRGSNPPGGDYAHARPSSNHPGGVVVAFCDARVKFTRESISSITINAARESALQYYMTPGGQADNSLNEPKPGSLKSLDVFAE